MCIFKALNNKPAITISTSKTQYPSNRPLPTYRENNLSTRECAKRPNMALQLFWKDKAFLSYFIKSLIFYCYCILDV